MKEDADEADKGEVSLYFSGWSATDFGLAIVCVREAFEIFELGDQERLLVVLMRSGAIPPWD